MRFLFTTKNNTLRIMERCDSWSGVVNAVKNISGYKATYLPDRARVYQEMKELIEWVEYLGYIPCVVYELKNEETGELDYLLVSYGPFPPHAIKAHKDLYRCLTGMHNEDPLFFYDEPFEQQILDLLADVSSHTDGIIKQKAYQLIIAILYGAAEFSDETRRFILRMIKE